MPSCPLCRVACIFRRCSSCEAHPEHDTDGGLAIGSQQRPRTELCSAPRKIVSQARLSTSGNTRCDLQCDSDVGEVSQWQSSQGLTANKTLQRYAFDLESIRCGRLGKSILLRRMKLNLRVMVVKGILPVSDGDNDSQLKSRHAIDAQNKGWSCFSHFVADLGIEVYEPYLATLWVNHHRVHQKRRV